MIRTVSVLVVLALLGLFAWFNLSVLTAVTPISFGFATVEAPFGLILLGTTASSACCSQCGPLLYRHAS